MSSNSEFDVDVRKDVMWMEPESNGATSRGVKGRHLDGRGR
jgi:hypothetical protein